MSSCIQEDGYKIKSLTAQPSVVLPLAYGELGIEDVLDDKDTAYIKIASDGLVSLYYTQTLRSPEIRQLITIPDASFNRSYSLPAANYPAAPSEFTFTPPQSGNLDFTYSPEKLSYLLFKQGTIRVSTTVLPSKPANFNYDVIVELPQTTKGGNMLSQRITGGTTTNIDLTGYEMNFAPQNTTTYTIKVIKKAHSGTVNIPGGTSVRVTLDFTSMDYELAKGFFGEQTANIPSQTIQVDPFNPLDKGTVSLADPRLSFEVVNEYGIPVNVQFVSLTASKSGSPVTKTIQLSTNPTDVNFPTVVGDSAKTLVNVVNAKELLDFKPDRFLYKINAVINKGVSPSTANFCEDQSVLKVRFKADVPLYGKASDIELRDTTDFDLSDIETSDIEALFIRANISNQLPIGARLQLYITDSQYKPIDSLFTNAQATTLVPSSTVNAQGELASPGTFVDDIPIEKSKVNNLLKGKYLIVAARLATTRNADGTQPDVKFKAAYKMNVKFGVRAVLNLKADL